MVKKVNPLKKALWRAGFSQRELAKLLDTTEAHISKACNGAVGFSPELAARAVSLFNKHNVEVTLADLLFMRRAKNQ